MKVPLCIIILTLGSCNAYADDWVACNENGTTIQCPVGSVRVGTIFSRPSSNVSIYWWESKS
jgi:hypothetical protein